MDGGTGADRVYGGAGLDMLYGTADSNSLYGDGGNDSRCGGNFDDLLNGGAGDDLLVVDKTGDQVIEAAGGSADTVTSGVIDLHGSAYANVEVLQLTGSADLWPICG